MYGTDFDDGDITSSPALVIGIATMAGSVFRAAMPGHEPATPDHMVTNVGFGVLVTCPVAPTDPQPPYTGRCPVCGCSMSGRTYADPGQGVA